MPGSRNLLSSKLRVAAAQLPYLPRALGFVWAAARRWTVAWAALLVAQGVLPVANVYLVKLLVDRLASAAGSQGARQDVDTLLLLAGLVAGTVLLAELLRSVTVWVRTAQAELVKDYIGDIIHAQSVGVDLAFYESPEYFDQLHRARYEATYRPIELLENLGGLAQSTITLVGMLAVLVTFGWWVLAVLLVGAAPALYVVLSHNLRRHHWYRRITADERRSWYYDWLMTSGETAAELRLYGLGGHFRSTYRGVRQRLRRERLALARGQSLAEMGAVTFSLLIMAGALGWVVWQSVLGAVTLGSVVLFYQAVFQCQRATRTALEHFGQVYTNSLFLSNLFEFLSLTPKVCDPPRPMTPPRELEQGINFKRVTFSYPGSDREALRDFDLEIPAGRFTAIVGMNGAGKSTLVKLLCRLYDPDSGSVEFDGIDLREMPVKELREMVSVLFQQPVHYSATVKENIAVGTKGGDADSAAVRDAARSAGADECVGRLPDGYDNLLGKWFEGGAELSVGEWQRVALARAFLRRSPVLVLDEPTSAMDPWAEADWLARFRRLAAGRTALVITHRFTTAMHADIIHVMSDGRVVESGSHEELIASGGLYAQSWLSQARLGELVAD
jgi:ATP-binding cassette subfamily B protein